MRISVVTFNRNEQAAVNQLLDDLVNEGATWKRKSREGEEDRERIERRFGDATWTLEHVALLAQGNVVAAAGLAALYRSGPQGTPDYVVFYGCAGALDKDDAHSLFLIDGVNYLSLGEVCSSTAGEVVTLKSKWLCYTGPPKG